MKPRILTQLTLALAFLGLPAVTPLKAGSYSTGFDTDPTLDAVPVQAFFNSRWDDGTGSDPGNPGGYMSLTDALNEQGGKLVFPDFEPGIPVKAFHFEVDCRVGGGTANPADGFSLNVVAPNDPQVTATELYAAGWAGWGGAMSLPEEGARTGIAIGFDEWDSGAPNPNTNGGPFALTPPTTTPPDIIGFSVRVDGYLIAQVPAATKNGDVTDVTSLQTGPNTSGVAGLGWARFIVDLNTDGKLDVTWKGTKVINQMQTNYTPAPRRIVFAARTGDSNSNHHFDNISMATTPATTATVTKAAATPTEATFEITDVPPSIVNSVSNPAQANIQLTIDGAAKTPLNITKVGSVTTIVYTPPAIYTSGSIHTYTLSARDATLATISKTGTFTLGSFVTVTAAHSVPAVQVDLTKPGFDIAMFQTDAARPGANPNRVLLSERQLRGEYGANTINLGAAIAGRFVHEGVINFSGDGDLDPDNVNTPLPAAAGNFLDDTEFYGLFGSTRAGDITDSISMEALCYVQLTRGNYKFGVNSDDGFRLSAGLSSPLGQTLGVFDGERDASSSEFDVFVETGGFYPLRLVWFEGGLRASCELYSVDAAGTRTLLNGPGGLPTYRVFPGATPTYVEWADPEPSSFAGLFETIGGHPINPIELDFSTIVAPGGVALTLDAAPVVPTLSTVDGKTVATITHPIFLSGSTHNVGITFTGKPTQTLTFTTLIYQKLSESLKLPLGALKDPGFVFRVAQINAGAVGTDGVTAIGGIGTVNDAAEAVVAGLFGTNVATPNADGDFLWGLDGVLNLDPDAPGNGNFIPNDPIPGIPGTLGSKDDIAAAVTTYVALPAPGLYTMGFNSDDGFRMRNSPNTPRQPLVINSPASVAGNVGSVRTPLAPLGAAQSITADIVLANPPNADPAILNGAALNGKIALIRRGEVTFAAKIERAQAAGAVAVIISNTLGRTPFPMGGTATVPITIPAVMISEPAGAAIEAALLLGPVSGNFGNEPQPVVGEFDGGRRASDTIFIVNALSAGLHPFRTSWNQGLSGANLEWFHVTSSGQKILLNDSSNPESLLTFKPTIAVTTVTFSATRDATVTWTSLPGARYTVQASTALTDGSWTTLARGILGAGATTSYVDPAVPAGQPQRFYRAVLE